jgi:hypothetical protein
VIATVPVSPVVPVSSTVHVISWTSPVGNVGTFGALSVHPAILTAISNAPAMYNFFIILFRI